MSNRRLMQMVPYMALLGLLNVDPKRPRMPIEDEEPRHRRWCNRCRGTGDIGNSRPCPKCQGGKK